MLIFGSDLHVTMPFWQSYCTLKKKVLIGVFEIDFLTYIQ